MQTTSSFLMTVALVIGRNYGAIGVHGGNMGEDEVCTDTFCMPTATTTTTIATMSPPPQSLSDEDFECPSSEREGLVIRISCILTYGGSIHDLIINYTLLLVNLVYCTAYAIEAAKSITSNTTATIIMASNTTAYRWSSLSVLVFVVVFQIVLCLGVGCTGISIIWCAMCGWIMSNGRERRQKQQHHHHQQHDIQQDQLQSRAGEDERQVVGNNQAANLGVLNVTGSSQAVDFDKTWLGKQRDAIICCDVIIIIYYAIASPFITTIAHFCALVLGAVLSTMTASRSPSLHENDSGEDRPSSTESARLSRVTEPLLTKAPLPLS